MPAFNQVIMVGNLTTDIQLSYTPKQTAVADTGMAVNESWKGQDGVKHDDTCFVDVRAFGKLAEVLNKYTKKGSCILVMGKLKFERWEKDGQRHSRHRVIAERVQFLTPNGSRVEQGGGPVPDEDIPF
jgi:single-strand DNA-binding protein